MASTNIQQRMMLQGYGQQLLAARRLARLRVQLRLAAGEDPRDPDPSLKRHLFVEKVAQELYDSLIFTGSDNPVVDEIRRELGKVLGLEVLFTYPPGGRLQIVGRGPQGVRPLSQDEERRTRQVLWLITKRKVDESMLARARSQNRSSQGPAVATEKRP